MTEDKIAETLDNSSEEHHHHHHHSSGEHHHHSSGEHRHSSSEHHHHSSDKHHHSSDKHHHSSKKYKSSNQSISENNSLIRLLAKKTKKKKTVSPGVAFIKRCIFSAFFLGLVIYLLVLVISPETLDEAKIKRNMPSEKEVLEQKIHSLKEELSKKDSIIKAYEEKYGKLEVLGTDANDSNLTE